MPTLTYRDARTQALREEMQLDANVCLMGEEVGVCQGAYKVSRGLLEEFGPMRIVDTPIAELGFAGIGVGAAVAGPRPGVEVITGDFAPVAPVPKLNTPPEILFQSGGHDPRPPLLSGPQTP